MNNRRNIILKKGFTLIELLVVVAIISLLSALVMSSLASARMKANDTRIAEDLRQFRIAAEMYFNDNKEYPPVAMDYKFDKKIGDNYNDSFWINKLAFFVKKANAAQLTPKHSITALCRNFDIAAIKMVDKKYLPAVPVHPYDNDANGVCYKAVRSTNTNTFSSYGALTSQVKISTGDTVSKRTGFIVGDTSKAGIEDLIDTSVGISPLEPAYPVGLDGEGDPFAVGTDELATIDEIAGITDGDDYNETNYPTESCAANYVYSNITSSCVPRVTCASDIGVFYDIPTNTCKISCPVGYHQVSQYPVFPCVLDGAPVIENTYELCHDGIDNDNVNGADMIDPNCANSGSIPPPTSLD